ncbi:hypothetical protein ACO0LM_10450 [Undibacterium sp. Di26W]
MSKKLRSEMPQTAGWVYQLRTGQGTEFVNTQLRKAIAGEVGHFWASENGHEVGTRDTRATSAYFLNERGRTERCDPDWMVDALALAKARGITIERKDFTDPDESREIAKKLRVIMAEAKYGK